MNEASISKRLKVIAGMVRHTSIADVGTDHALLPIFMCGAGLIEKAVACDVNKGPLDSAKKNIAKSGLGNVIETRLGSGIEPILTGECETLVIAGMGGALIIELLSAEIDKAKAFKQLVLQPQRSMYGLRKFLAENGFVIHNEILVEENDIFYFIYDVATGEVEDYTEEELRFGKYVQKNNPIIFRKFIRGEVAKCEKILTQHNAGDAVREYLQMCKRLISGCDN